MSAPSITAELIGDDTAQSGDIVCAANPRWSPCAGPCLRHCPGLSLDLSRSSLVTSDHRAAELVV
jgi:hypothetical protein